MLSKEGRREIERIVKENKKWTDKLEKWDRTGIDPFAETLVSFSIKEENHQKLKRIAKARNESMSNIIDSLIEETE